MECVDEPHVFDDRAVRHHGRKRIQCLFNGTHGRGWYPWRAVPSAFALSPGVAWTRTIPTKLDGTDLRLGLVVAQWYPEVTDRLRDAAIATARAAGVSEDDILIVEVPGCYELPQGAAWLARSDDVDAIAALGCVLRGETPHFDHVARGCCDGLLQVGLETGIPVGLGVITADTKAQAEARSSDATGKGGNKGTEATDAAIRMAATARALEARRKTS